MEFDVTLADIEAAAKRIAGRVRRTPTYVSSALSERLGVETVVKFEGLQDAGSFKVRGCYNKLLSLTEDERQRGVVTTSGGNHAIAVSHVAGRLGIDALVLMPKVTPAFNIGLTKAAGGNIELCEDAAEAFAKAEAYGKAGRTFVHPYDDPLIIAGHGTLGLEMLDDGGALTHAFFSIGGGGFGAGVAAALKGRNPAVRIHGVETEGAETMTRALAEDKPVTIKPSSLARTLGAPFVTDRTLGAAKRFLEEVVIVSDRDAVAELLDLLRSERVLVEPAASAVVAAALARRSRFKKGDRVGLILCGSNAAFGDVLEWKGRFGL